MSQKIKRAHVLSIYRQKLNILFEQAHRVHRDNFISGEIQASSLLSIKTGGCPENCSYCPQSAHYQTGIKKTQLIDKKTVLDAASQAKKMGATRFCMGAAWREIKDGPDFENVLIYVHEVKKLGLEVCCTLGMLSKNQAQRLKDAGLHAYNHNIDTSREYYRKIIQTRTYDDRLQTIRNIRDSGLTVCTGGILGMGETDEDRISFILQLANFDPQPESITINILVPIKGTPMEKKSPLGPMEIVRVISTLRITNPKSMIRLSAGRLSMTDETQFLCFYSGANSIFVGEKLLTSPNPTSERDQFLLQNLGFHLKKERNLVSP